MVCRRLSWWITEQEKPEIFWRSATSGAKATQDARQGHKVKQGGDLISIDPAGHWLVEAFSIECKNRHDYGNLDLTMEREGEWLKWWDQCCEDADRASKQPLMIFQRFRRPAMIAHLYDQHSPGGWTGVMEVPQWHIVLQMTTSYRVMISPFEEWMATNPADLIQDWCQ